MSISSRHYRNISTAILSLAVVVCAWLWWNKTESAFISEKKDTGVGTVAGQDSRSDSTKGPSLPDHAAKAQPPIEEIRQQAQQRAKQIRAAQEQLRGGAQPEEVREPEVK